jgi:hypothetical protein
MRVLLLLPLLLMFVTPVEGQTATGSDDGSAMAVLSFKWSKRHLTLEKHEAESTAPATVITPDHKNFQRSRRVNAQAGERDPIGDTEDGRRAALEKIVQESRTVQTTSLDGFDYRVKVRNTSAKVAEIIFWEYRFSDGTNPETVTRRQFLCGVQIKPDKSKELQAFSVSGPSEVISVASLANDSANSSREKVLINRVEYSDGSIWQRKDWKFAEIKLTYERAIATPWGSEMCRAL